MRTILCRWLMAEWGFLAFLAYGFVGVLSLPRYFVVVGWGLVGIALASILSGHGIVDFWIALPFTSLLVFLLVWAFLLGRLLLFFPFPPCRNGECRGIIAYQWPIGSIYGRVQWGVYDYWCRCGDEYIREGKRFFRVLPDGSKKPYMTLTGFRTWTPAVAEEGTKEGEAG
jgi:hypothetical protein